jgi:formylglycine-generating enzyme required for sulfatase activity
MRTIFVILTFFCGASFQAGVSMAIDPMTPRRDQSVTNSIGMHFAKMPAGEFEMGAPASDNMASTDEFPQHHVRIAHSFLIGIHEVTVGQFRSFVNATKYRTAAQSEPSSGFDDKTQTFQYDQLGFNWESLGWKQTDDHPVLNVTWFDAVKFCEWLSKKESNAYRLPTEAEWEYACRAGTAERFIFGDSVDTLRTIANVQDKSLVEKRPRFSNSEFSTYLKGPVPWNDGYPFSAPVGRFEPNKSGLYDMLGNANEWCADYYQNDYYNVSPPTDPRGPESGKGRVIRGGSFLHQPRHCRITQRVAGSPTYHNYITGFRVVMGEREKK